MREKLNANGQAVLDVVRAAHDHPTAAEIFEKTKEIRPDIGIASVYRILHNLVQQGKVREIKGGDESSRYDGHVERHDHAVCARCGKLLDVPITIPLPQDIIATAAQATGIVLESYELRLYGLCPDCQAHQEAERKSKSTTDTISTGTH